MKKLILWDIDGTLIHTAGAGKRAFFSAFTSATSLITFKDDVSFSGSVDRWIYEELCRINGISDSASLWPTFLFHYKKALIKEAGNRAEWKLLPGLPHVIDDLSNKYVHALLTGNCKEKAYIKLDIFNLSGYFPCGGFGDTLTDRSDVAREAYKESCTHYAQEFIPSEVIVIGDTPRDVECAKAIGAVAIAVLTGFATEETIRKTNPDYILKDLLMLPEIIGA